MTARLRPRDLGGLRAAHAAKLRGLIARYGHLGNLAGPWRDELDRLEAGEPVEVPGWALSGGARRRGLHPNQRVVLESGGSITVVES